jgi:hypothetical protein
MRLLIGTGVSLFAGTALAAIVQGNVTAAQDKSPPGSKTYCWEKKCWLTRGNTLRAMLTGTGIAAATHFDDDEPNLGTSLTGLKYVPNQVEVNVTSQSDTSRGWKDLFVRQKVAGSTVTEWPFKVMVVRNAQISNAQIATPNSFFTEAEIVVNGSSLGNAKVVHAPDAPTPKPSIQITENTSERVKIKLSYGTLQSVPQVKLRLCDESDESIYCQFGWGTVSGQIKGPSAVRTIAFYPSNPKVGDDMRIEFTLDAPAANALRLYWRLSSPGDFAPGASSCDYDPIGTAKYVNVAAGNQVVSCIVKVSAATGAGLSAASRTLESWVNDTSKLTAPWYKTQTFSVKP